MILRKELMKMKVVLVKDVKSQGKKGDVINVSDGYARNFLLPRGLAKEASTGALNDLKGQKEAAEFHHNNEVAAAKETAAKIEGVTVSLTAKAGENGKLFGSVTASDVAEALKMQHHVVIEKKKFSLPDGIKHTGITEVEVKVYPSITAKIKVNVTAAG